MSTQLVYLALQPRCVYRVRDVSEATGLDYSHVARALQSLASGGLLEMFSDVERGRRRLYQTRQLPLL